LRVLAAIAESIPTVAIASRVEALKLHSVDIDNRGGGRLATTHLIENGHRAIATITGPLDWPSAQARLEGTREALRDAGVEAKLAVASTGEWGVEAGRSAMAELMRSGDRFTAVFAQSDLLALGAIAELQARGLSVPGDMSVIGYDDIPVARYMSPALTTVRQPMNEVGATAVRLLTQELAGPSPSGRKRRRHQLVDVSLVVRQSVAGPAQAGRSRRG
jgi:LacI family repressor for deo operon, udp, cdd, tsx, nupC, and nupG